jgi:hypothetical protein
MKGFVKKMFLLSGLFLLSWLLFAQSCMSFRKSDAEEMTEFAKDHVKLYTSTLKVDGRNIHYALTGQDPYQRFSLFMAHPVAGMLFRNT